MVNDSYISIDNVSKRFGAVTAVDQVNLNIASGEFFSLLGASGCGKTTLLRMLAGFEAPSDGEIYLDGAAMSQVPPHLRPTNMVFQSYAIFPHLDVRANVAYGLRKDKLPKEELGRRVAEALEMVKLSGFESRKSNEMSGGQRQRVALARALIKRPKVLLLDEPLGALDKKLREEMQLELRALQREVGITFIFVTHDQEEALTLSDRIAVMEMGQVLQVASPGELYERPTSVAVADFIGQMNFMAAEVVDIGGAAAEVQVQGFGRLSLSGAPDYAAKGSQLVAAIRPEKLHLSFAEPTNGAQTVQGEVGAAAYLGDRSHYYVKLAGCEKPIAVAAQNMDRAHDTHGTADRPVWLSWAKDAFILLPTQ
ncbi:MAG: ABC transporter ATP-binding protein [Pseudomonadota bacterium]